MKHIIHYAHCVKWTVGQLDRAPYSEYQMRASEVDVVCQRHDDIEEWLVKCQGKIIANEDSVKDALAIATHALMSMSRARFTEL